MAEDIRDLLRQQRGQSIHRRRNARATLRLHGRLLPRPYHAQHGFDGNDGNRRRNPAVGLASLIPLHWPDREDEQQTKSNSSRGGQGFAFFDLFWKCPRGLEEERKRRARCSMTCLCPSIGVHPVPSVDCLSFIRGVSGGKDGRLRRPLRRCPRWLLEAPGTCLSQGREIKDGCL